MTPSGALPLNSYTTPWGTTLGTTLGRNPQARFVCISHTSELAAKHHDDRRRLMRSSYYQDLFAARISRDKDTGIEFRMGAGGGRFSISVGGPLTGRGGDIIIIDDPLKADEAHSETQRRSVNTWYGEPPASRLNDPKSGAIVLVMQRLHDDDLAGHVPGHVLEQGGGEHLNPPAIAEEDQNIQIGPQAFEVRRADALLRTDRRAPNAIAIKPEHDKQMRLGGQSHKFEAGDVILPEAAPWLADFEAELLAFPKGRYDDQVDALSQYLRWADKRRSSRISVAKGWY